MRILLKNGADPEAMDYANKKPLDNTNNYAIKQMIERELEVRRSGDTSAQKVVNWMVSLSFNI